MFKKWFFCQSIATQNQRKIGEQECTDGKKKKKLKTKDIICFFSLSN